MRILMFLRPVPLTMYLFESLPQRQLFKVVCAETGVSLTSPMELKINDVLYNRNDKRTIEEAGICNVRL